MKLAKKLILIAEY